MEKQANQLTPRIQMLAEPFKVKAKEYVARFMRESNVQHENEVMEQVITALETAALICFGMHLPPCISFKLMEVLRCPLSLVNLAHQWISEALYI